MRILAIDIGEKRCGLAMSDPGERIATPLDVVPLSDAVNNTGAFARALEDWEPELLLFGLPKSLDGHEGKQASRIRAIAGQITKACGIEGAFIDERLSSREAHTALHEMGYDSKSMKGKVDMIAASFFLQTFIDSKRRDAIASS